MNDRNRLHLQQNYPNLLRAISLMRLTAWALLAFSLLSAAGMALAGVLVGFAGYEEQPAQAIGGAVALLVLATAELLVAGLAYIFAQSVPELLSLFVSIEVGVTTIADRRSPE